MDEVAVDGRSQSAVVCAGSPRGDVSLNPLTNRLATKKHKNTNLKLNCLCFMCLLWLWFDRHHHYAVARDFGRKLFGDIAEVLAGPEVTHLPRQVRRISDIGPRHGDFCRLWTTIEQYDCSSTIGQLFGPDFLLSILSDAPSLHSKRILIDCDHFAIRQYLRHVTRHATQIVSRH